MRSSVHKDLAQALTAAAHAAGTSLAPAALHIARIENPRLDVESYKAKLDAMGELARQAVQRRAERTGDSSRMACIKAVNEYLFEDLHFVGNRERYEDPRNSCLNEVLDRRTGIPITLCVVYMEVARRAGLHIDGVNFPGHFLVRCPETGGRGSGGLIIDPFHGGALLSEQDCRMLLQRQVGDEVAFSKSLLAPTTRMQILVRMLINLKRIYVHMRSFPQARDVTVLLLAMTPSALSELDKESREEQEQIWEHVKTLRRRVASLN